MTPPTTDVATTDTVERAVEEVGAVTPMDDSELSSSPSDSTLASEAESAEVSEATEQVQATSDAVAETPVTEEIEEKELPSEIAMSEVTEHAREK